MGLLRTALADLGLPPEDARGAPPPLGEPAPLDAVLPVARLAEDAVRFAALAAGRVGVPPTPLDPDRIATSFTSDRFFRLNGQAPETWAPLSGFWATADGWIRVHANYPHHRRALLDALRIPEADDDATKDRLRDALRALPSRVAEELIVAAGGVAAAVRTVAEWHAHPHGARVAEWPLLRIREREPGGAAPQPTLRSGAARPLTGTRVLDLTRVLAGPIATRTLALWGADVLRIDPPFLPEAEWTHLDTGAGKRSALLDLRTDRERFRELLASADVLVHGYRPGALPALGLDELIAERPGLLVASLGAWGPGPWEGRRGFDSIVQAASGIAMTESPDGERPGALPAQALDHSAGYLLAGAVALLLDRRSRHGGAWAVEVSLARIADELLGMPREARSAESSFEPTVSTVRSQAGILTLARPAFGAEDYRFPPRPFGADEPAWAPSRAASAGDG